MSQQTLMVGGLLVIVTLAGYGRDSSRSSFSQVLGPVVYQQRRVAASPPILSEHERIELDRMAPQQQAERLLERATNGYQGALELIGKKVDSWRGLLKLAGPLYTLITSALNSDDLRVRAATIEISLAAYNVEKAPESVHQRIRFLESEQGDKVTSFWILGALGNRGVEVERVFQTLLRYTRDQDMNLRRRAVEGLGVLGTDATIEPLLDVFRNDPSAEIRERAACSLAQSGMLDQTQRMKAVPTLLNYLEDSTLEPAMHQWVLQALQDISGKNFGDSPVEWRRWYNTR